MPYVPLPTGRIGKRRQFPWGLVRHAPRVQTAYLHRRALSVPSENLKGVSPVQVRMGELVPIAA